MAKHHVISPSAMPRLSNCVGSLYGPTPDRSSSEAAREGTACHSLLEFCLTFGEDPRNMLGSDSLDAEFPVNIEMVEAVELFISEIKRVCDEHNISHDRIVAERRLVHPRVSNDMFGGTMDCQVLGDDVLITADLKYGRKQVYADSPQLTAYSILSLGSLPPERSAAIRKVVQLLIQPRGNPQVTRHEPGADELWTLTTRIQQIEQYVLANPDLTVRPPVEALSAGEWCKYCPNRVGCPARDSLANELVQIGTFRGPDLKMIASPTSDIPTDVLVRWLEMADVVKEFLADVGRALKVRAIQGQPIPRHKLVLGYGDRQFIDGPEAAAKKLPRAGLGLAKKDLFVQKQLSVAQTEKLLKERDVLKDKELKAKWESFIESKLVGCRLVSEKSRGEAVRPETAGEFLAALELESKSDE
jgi:hypothetical protein